MTTRYDTQKHAKKSKTRKILLYVLLGTLLVLGAGLIYWNTNKKQIIGNKIEKKVREKSGGLYSFKYDSIELNELDGHFSISNMHVSVDSTGLKQIIQEKGMPPVLIDVKIPQLRFSGLKTPKAFFNNKLIASRLEISNPVIEVSYSGKKKGREKDLPGGELRKIILGDLSLIDIDSIIITGGRLISKTQGTGKNKVEIEGFEGNFQNVYIDSLADLDSNRILFSDEFALSAKKATWGTANKYYRMSLENIRVNSAQQALSMGKFSVGPTMNETAFAKSHPVQEDRVDFWSTSIQFTGVNIGKLFSEELVADKMEISQASCKIYRDLTLARSTEKRTFYLYQKRKEEDFLFNIKHATIKNSLIEYKELNDISHRTWKMTFNDTKLDIKNLTNAGKASEITSVDISARFLNKTPVTLNWIFYLNDPTGRFAVKGKTGSLNDGTWLNQIVEPTSMAHVRQGSLQVLSCDLAGNDNSVSGTVNLLYKDLKIDVLEKDPGATKTDKKFLTSLFLNVKTKDENPKGNNPPRVAIVTVPRDPRYSIFNAGWKTIFNGISEITGIPMPRR